MWNSGSGEQFRRNNFDSLRLAFSLMVLFSHSFVAVVGDNSGEPLYRATFGATDFGDLAVDGFFAVSGFLICRSWSLSPDLKKFLAKRIRRIFPGFATALLFQGLVLAPWTVAEPPGWYSPRQALLFLFNLFTLTGYGYPYGGLLKVFPTNPVPGELNVSLWTLRYEATCYLALAAGASLFKQHRRACLLTIMCGVYLLYAAGWAVPWHRGLTALVGAFPPWPRLATYFMLGTSLWVWRAHIPRSTPLAMVALAAFVCSLVAPWANHTLEPLSFTYLVFWCAYLPPVGRTFFEKYGDWSYGTYLYGFPLQQMVVHFLGTKVTPLRVFGATLPLALTAGGLSWYLVERRFLGRRAAA